MKKAMMWGSIKMSTLTDGSRAHIAEMMVQGTVMGITALRTTDFSMDSMRQLLPGMTYELPPKQDKRDPLTVEQLAADADGKQDAAAVAKDFRERVVPVMERLRGAVDALEMLVGRDFWPVPTYGDLMFET